MKQSFSGLDRETQLQEMASEGFDLLVIGGGITGAGIALDAENRGLHTALVEMQDFAAGTSSRSTKLVHGGLRYLKQLEVKMVAEVGKERAIVYENGPHVTMPEWMLLPFYKGGTFGKLTTSLALRVYDYLAGVKRTERRKMFTAEETIKRVPLLKTHGLRGGGHYVEYRTDDARLTIEVMKKAVSLGARAVNYAKVEELLYENGFVSGARVVDQIDGRSYSIRAAKVINAAGPWVDTLREKDQSKAGKTLHVTKGVHLVFGQQRFPLSQASYFDTPDKRMVFAIPRDGKTYVGTTDTNYAGEMVNPRMTTEDRSYLLHVVNDMFPSLQLTEADVESSWAGLRPLIHQEGRDPSEISRKDEIFVSASGLISIAGGKLTGYRKMAETVVNQVAGMLTGSGRPSVPSSGTKHLPISGGDIGGSANWPGFVLDRTKTGRSLGLTDKEAEQLVRRYGSNVDAVFALVEAHRSSAEAASLPAAIAAALVYSIEQEMTVKPVDFFIRRTGALFFDIAWVRKWKDSVIAYMSERFHWTHEQTSSFSIELDTQLHDAVEPVDA